MTATINEPRRRRVFNRSAFSGMVDFFSNVIIAKGMFYECRAVIRWCMEHPTRELEKKDEHRVGIPCIYLVTRGRGEKTALCQIAHCSIDVGRVAKKSANVIVKISDDPSKWKHMRIRLDDPRLIITE